MGLELLQQTFFEFIKILAAAFIVSAIWVYACQPIKDWFKRKCRI